MMMASKYPAVPLSKKTIKIIEKIDKETVYIIIFKHTEMPEGGECFEIYGYRHELRSLFGKS